VAWRNDTGRKKGGEGKNVGDGGVKWGKADEFSFVDRLWGGSIVTTPKTSLIE